MQYIMFRITVCLYGRELQQSLSAMHQIQEEKESLSKRTKNLEANLEVSSFPYQL